MIPDAWRREGSVVAVVGLGKSGVAATKLLAREGAHVYASDASDHPYGGAAAVELRELAGVEVDVGRHDLAKIRSAAGVVVSPGVPPDAAPLAAAREAGVPVGSEIDLGFRALAGSGTRCIAITGTNGKTTTTALVAHLLRAAGLAAEAAGNIGRPLTDIAVTGDRYQWLAVEVSSFQLHDSPHFAPEIGILTNLAPDHLDRYASVDAYYHDKQLLFSNARARDVWVLNGDDPAALELPGSAPGRRVLFSLRRPAGGWYDAAARRLRLGEGELLPRDELRLLGDHNVATALAAALAVREAGLAPAAIAQGLRSFRALPHRLEPVREVGGVLWINDSKATNIASTVVAVEAMDRRFVLLPRGAHKGGAYTRPAPPLAGESRAGVAVRGARAGGAGGARLLALLAAVLVVFGLTAVYGASSLLTTAGGQVGSAFALRQALGALVGGVAATLLARSDYRRWRRYAWPVLGAATLLLVIPLLPFTHRVAPTLNGARRWVDLGFVTVQPSELAKFAVVVWTAMLAAKKGEQIRTFRNGLLPFLVILAPLVGLIFLEPNLSMALLVAILAGVVLFTAGARIGHFLLVAVVAAPLVFGGIMTAQYRVARVLTFL